MVTTPKIQRPVIKINSIEEAIHRLLIGGSFFATVVAGIRRRPVPAYICDTIAVVCNGEADIGIELIFNPDFIENITDINKLAFVIEHECVHLIMKHHARFYADPRLAGMDWDVFNIAADLAVNTVITRHYSELLNTDRDFMHLPEDFDMRPGLSMEAYAQILQAKFESGVLQAQAKSKNPETQESDDGVTSLFQKHGVNPHFWGMRLGTDENGNPKLVPITKDEAKGSEVKQETNLGEYIERCVRSYNKSQGELPNYVSELVKDFVRLKSDVHWTEILKHKVASGMRGVRQRSVMRPSRRRYGLPDAVPKFPGNTYDHTYKVALIMDTSGSMTYQDLAAAKETLKSLLDHYKNTVKVYVVHADTQVHKVQELKTIGEFDMKIEGRGGTDFREPIKYVEKNLAPDIMLYFTDGWGTPPYKAPKAKLVWFISEGGKNPTENLPEKYGEEVHVKYSK